MSTLPQTTNAINPAALAPLAMIQWRLNPAGKPEPEDFAAYVRVLAAGQRRLDTEAGRVVAEALETLATEVKALSTSNNPLSAGEYADRRDAMMTAWLDAQRGRPGSEGWADECPAW